MRLKLKYGKNQPLLSPQFLMTCNYMNEGCDGGWPFFHGFMAENGHLVTEECAPYTGKTKGDSCSNYQQCEPHSKIDNTYFVGKGYGDSTEKKMMKEIMRNGLVNGELQAPHIFSMYQSGVLTKTGIKQLHRKVLELAQTDRSKKTVHKKMGAITAKVTDKTLADYGISW
jgi:cathepsin C